MPIGYFITVDFRRKDTIYLERQLGQLGQLDCPLAEPGLLGRVCSFLDWGTTGLLFDGNENNVEQHTV
jgi:hypothetical protein